MLIRRIVPLVLSLALLPACTKQTKYQFETTPPASAGTAEIRMTAVEAGNGQVTLQFEHLAPPKKIDPSLTAYVIWTQIGGNNPTKLGVLDYDIKKRSGKLTATYVGTRIKIIVTLEKDPSTPAPTGPRILDVDLAAPTS